MGRGGAAHALRPRSRSPKNRSYPKGMNASPPVRENRLDHLTILDAGDDPKRPAAGPAALNVAAVDASQTLCLHALQGAAIRAAPPGLARFRLHLTVGIAALALAAGTASGGRHAHPKGVKAQVSTVGSKHAVEAREVHARLPNEGCETSDEVQRRKAAPFEHDVGGAVAPGRLEVVADVPPGVSERRFSASAGRLM